MPETTIVEGLTNREFLEKYAAPGRVGLMGGPELINRLIRRAQRHLDDQNSWSHWSHAFLFQGRRRDGHHWIVESDLDIKHKHIRLGVQENRISKYFDETTATSLAILDFGLTPGQEEAVLAGALELVADGTRYSLREIAGTIWALRHPRWRPRENLLIQEKAFYCSSFVRHVFGQAGLNLIDGVAEKNTAPEHIVRTAVPHTKWLLVRRDPPPGRLRRLARRIRRR
ncbi:MAG TPA: hypothetical protein VG734_24775 [Lacunisphaera sp.]|nr:hypothetical protein [Lacunisphaera sp.]